jgi:hypothetical protein
MRSDGGDLKFVAALTAFFLIATPAAAEEAAAAAAAPAQPAAAAPTPPAAQAPAPASPPASPPASDAQIPKAEGAAPPKSNLDFDLLPESSATKEDTELEAQIRTRRSLLIIHQALGIATVALITTGVVFGQLNYDDRFGGGPSNGTYEVWHSSFITAGTITFIGAGTLALLAPVPLTKHSGFDSITVHKWSMLVASLCFAAEIPLGIYTVSQEGHTNQASLALAHLILGYITATALAVGTAALFF